MAQNAKMANIMMQRSWVDGVVKQDEDPDQVYLTIPVNYGGDMGNTGPEPARIDINRSAPVVMRMEDFYVAVVRLSYAAFTVPLMIANLQVGTPFSSNLTTFGFTLSYNGFTSGITYVIWEALIPGNGPPSGNVGIQLQSFNPYYWAYSYDVVCRMINTCLQTAFTALSVASGGTLPVGSKPPKFWYDPIKQSSVWQVQEANYDTYNTVTPIVVSFNNSCSCLFSGYDYKTLYGGPPAGSDHDFIFTKTFNNVDTVDAAMINIYPLRFDPSYWGAIDTFQCNSTIPVVYEQTTVPNLTYNDPRGYQVTQPNVPLIPLSKTLIDLQPDFGSPQAFGSLFIYNKVDNYRYYELSGKGPLISFSLDFTFTTYNGDVVPLNLVQNTNCIVKLGFFKRSLITHDSKNIIQLLKTQARLLADH